MFKNKYPLKLFAIISLALVVLTTVIVCIFGVNTSIEIGGGSQIEITLSTKSGETVNSGRENVEQYVETIEDILKDHGSAIDSYIVEDKYVDTYLIVRSTDNEIEGASTIPSEIATKLGIDLSRVSTVQKLSSYFTDNQMLYIGLAVLTVIVIAFFLGWIRYSINGGVTLAFSILHNLILSLAIIFVTRVQFSTVSLIGTLIFTLLSAIVTTLILERKRENSKSKQYAELSESAKMFEATKQNKHLLWIAAVLFALMIVMLCIPIRYIALAGVSLIICLVVCAYTAICVTPALNVYLSETFIAKEKQRLSKNVTTKSTKK